MANTHNPTDPSDRRRAHALMAFLVPSEWVAAAAEGVERPLQILEEIRELYGNNAARHSLMSAALLGADGVFTDDADNARMQDFLQAWCRGHVIEYVMAILECADITDFSMSGRSMSDDERTHAVEAAADHLPDKQAMLLVAHWDELNAKSTHKRPCPPRLAARGTALALTQASAPGVAPAGYKM